MTWKDITIEKYDKILALQQQDLNETDLVVATLAILEGTTVKAIENQPYALLLLKAKNLRFLNDKPLASLVKRVYELNGKRYVPTLNPALLTTAQYIDFQVRATEAPEDLAGLLSIILIPEGKKYNEDYLSDEVREDIYKYLPIEDGMGLSAFFFTLWKKSTRRLLRQSKRQYRRLKWKRHRTAEETALMETVGKMIETISEVQKHL